MLGLEALTGGLEDFGFEDYLNGNDFVCKLMSKIAFYFWMLSAWMWLTVAVKYAEQIGFVFMSGVSQLLGDNTFQFLFYWLSFDLGKQIQIDWEKD